MRLHTSGISHRDDDPCPWDTFAGGDNISEARHRRRIVMADDIASRVRTPGQKRRLQRNLLILTSHRAGMGASAIAELMDLPRRTVRRIIETFESRYAR